MALHTYVWFYVQLWNFDCRMEFFFSRYPDFLIIFTYDLTTFFNSCKKGICHYGKKRLCRWPVLGIRDWNERPFLLFWIGMHNFCNFYLRWENLKYSISKLWPKMNKYWKKKNPYSYVTKTCTIFLDFWYYCGCCLQNTSLNLHHFVHKNNFGHGYFWTIPKKHGNKIKNTLSRICTSTLSPQILM